MDDEEIQELNQFEGLIQGLIEDSYGCCNDFVLQDTVIGLAANMAILNDAGKMKTAGIGNKMDFQKDKLIRSDKINWIEQQSTNQYEVIFLKKIWRFINHLNKTCFTSIKSFECHYSNYEQGSFYKRHLDQFNNEDGRKYSIAYRFAVPFK